MDSNLKKWKIQAAFGQISDCNIHGPCNFSLLVKECGSIKEYADDTEAYQSLAYCFYYIPLTVENKQISTLILKRVFIP